MRPLRTQGLRQQPQVSRARSPEPTDPSPGPASARPPSVAAGYRRHEWVADGRTARASKHGLDQQERGHMRRGPRQIWTERRRPHRRQQSVHSCGRSQFRSRIPTRRRRRPARGRGTCPTVRASNPTPSLATAPRRWRRKAGMQAANATAVAARALPQSDQAPATASRWAGLQLWKRPWRRLWCLTKRASLSGPIRYRVCACGMAKDVTRRLRCCSFSTAPSTQAATWWQDQVGRLLNSRCLGNRGRCCCCCCSDSVGRGDSGGCRLIRRRRRRYSCSITTADLSAVANSLIKQPARPPRACDARACLRPAARTACARALHGARQIDAQCATMTHKLARVHRTHRPTHHAPTRPTRGHMRCSISPHTTRFAASGGGRRPTARRSIHRPGLEAALHVRVHCGRRQALQLSRRR
mmetsp:Transcript_24697/g.79491  ORF Transcript_24697/g.79491 Transcript_24697/m.79491 type:complete len:412 (-) Transcript_24697:302-1537(-)